MPSVLWLTDLHLNFVRPDVWRDLIQEIVARKPSGVLVGGDTAEARSWEGYLAQLAEEAGCPVHFVLGNHDYYRSSIAAVREAARSLCQRSPMLNWLPASDVTRIGPDAVLIGHGGWGDARTPEYRTSDVILNDYFLIDELRAASGADLLGSHSAPTTAQSLLTPELQETLRLLGDEAGAHFQRVLPIAAAQARHIVVLMHVPPFREACWHQGHVSDDNWAPHFTCVAAGAALADFMRTHPAHRMTVLCGHTHSSGLAQVLPNLTVLTGAATYGHPALQEPINVS